MNTSKLKNWLYPGMNGTLAIVFGLIAIVFPSITLVALAIYFAISIMIGGVLLCIGAWQMKNMISGWPSQMFEGIVGILLGIVILSNPKLSVAVFVAIVGIWAILMGFFFLYMYVRRKLPHFEKGFLLVVGVLSLVFGLLITLNPFQSSRFIVVLIGLYAIAYGLFSIINGRRLYGK